MTTTTPCIETTACRNWFGYGIVRREGRAVRHHRWIYALANGLTLADLDGLEIRHRCDNPGCINPSHLIAGSHTDNMRDMAERGRNRQPKGERNGRAKLTEGTVAEIRSLVAAGVPHREIASHVGIDKSQVSRVATRKIWRHVA